MHTIVCACTARLCTTRLIYDASSNPDIYSSNSTPTELNRAKQRSGAGLNLSLRLYASTYNLGAAGRDVSALGSLEAWIPLGFDLYIIVHVSVLCIQCGQIWIEQS